ncbi:MAG: CUB domain-containing protein [Gelidibacter sp.]
MKKLILLFILTITANLAFSQGTDILSSEQFCSGTSQLTFNNVYGGDDLTSVGCLGSIPNAAYFYLQIDQPGDLTFTIAQQNTGGIPIDVDFIAWGPFIDLNDANTNISYTDCFSCPNNTYDPAFYPYAPDYITDCSFDIAPTETLHILNAQQGEIYVVLITNYDGDEGTISFQQTSGTGTTTCANFPICGGNFYDTGGPTGSYFNNESYITTIYPYFAGGTVSVDFTSFNVSAGDLLTVYNGPTTINPLGTVTSAPSTFTSTTVGNPTGALTFQFVSNGSGTAAGWESNITCTAPPMPATCGSTFYDSGGIGGNYSNNESQITTFFPDTAGDAVTATFTTFNTESGWDYLRVYDGPNTTFPLIGNFSGTTIPGPFTSSDPSGALTFVFTSDSSGRSAGWSADLTCAPYVQPLVCGSTFYDSGGIGGNYSNNESQTTTFFPDTAGDAITATFTAFEIESCCDELRVYDGPNTTSPLIGTYAGTTIPGPFTSTDPSGALTFVFTSDGTVTNSGWMANITCSTPTCALTIDEVLNPLGADDCSLNYSQLTAVYSGNSSNSTTIFSEDFNGAAIPIGWTIANATASANWNITNSSNAGGIPYEATLSGGYDTSANGNWTLASPAINITGNTNLQLSFKQYLSHFSSSYSYSISMQTNIDGAGWVNQYVVNNVANNISPETHNVGLSSLSGNSLRIRFKLNGHPFGLNYWYIDNIKLTADGAPTSQITWSPISGLYTDAALLSPYTTGLQIDTVYAAPNGTQTYTATHQNGCSETASVTRNKKIWKGALDTDWNNDANWFPIGVPTNTNCIVIPDALTTPNDAIIYGTTDGDGLNLTIKNGGSLLIESNGTLTIVDQVTIETLGMFKLEDSASLIQVNNTPSTNNVGNIIMDRDTNIRLTDYVYWSSPVNQFNVANIYGTNTPTNYIYEWITTIPTNTTTPGPLFIPICFGDWSSYAGIMENGKGYIVRGPIGHTNTPSNYTATFTGVPNNGIITKSISSGTNNSIGNIFQYIPSGGSDLLTVTEFDDNWNLIGNPYPSALNAQKFLMDNTNIEGAVHIWTHNNPLGNYQDSFYDDFALNYSISDYITYNYSGTNTYQDESFAGNIASGQGFFVLSNNGENGTIYFDNSMRNKTFNNSDFYRSNQIENTTHADTFEHHRIWLSLIAPNSQASSILVGYIEGATLEKDRLYDASNMEANALNLYSKIGQNRMVIQGRPLPFNEEDQVPLGTVIPDMGIYKIAISGVDGLFTDENQNIYLEDTYTNNIHNLRASPYVFTVDNPITFDDRFILRYTDEALSTDNPVMEANVSIFSTKNLVKVTSGQSPIHTVSVYDILGRKLVNKEDINALSFTLSTNLSDGTYIVKVTLNNKQQKIKKIILKH